MKPRIFIGSSVEGKPIADAIQSNFSYKAYPTVWDQNIFLPSSYTLDSLLKAVVEYDFAILVFSPDDILRIRETTAVVPRGNVVFEAAPSSESTVETDASWFNHATIRRSNVRQISRA